jgi:hypothetical protein
MVTSKGILSAIEHMPIKITNYKREKIKNKSEKREKK